MTRYIAFGDIHGMVDELRILFSEINQLLQPDDVLVFLGDYIDRGTDSKATLDFLMNLDVWVPNEKVFLRGNHEDMFLQRNSSLYFHTWLSNGGYKCLQDFGCIPGIREDWNIIPERYDAWVKRTLHFYEPKNSNLFFVHAGVDPDYPLDNQTEQDMMWIRNKFLDHQEPFERIVVHGHTPYMDGIDIRTNRINVDTGSCFGGALSCVILNPDGSVVSTHSVPCMEP